MYNAVKHVCENNEDLLYFRGFETIQTAVINNFRFEAETQF